MYCPTAERQSSKRARQVTQSQTLTHSTQRGKGTGRAHSQRGREAHSMYTHKEAQTHTTTTHNDVYTQHTNSTHNKTLTVYTSTHYSTPQDWAWYYRALTQQTVSTHYTQTR